MTKNKELVELRKQNFKLKELISYYTQANSSRLVFCNRCKVPLASKESRIRVILNKRGEEGYSSYSDRQIGVFHLDCYKEEVKKK